MSTPSDEEMDRWYTFWDNMVPGTLFLVNSELLVWMEPNDSHNTRGSMFNIKNGTIHHYTEYFDAQCGIEYVKSRQRSPRQIFLHR